MPSTRRHASAAVSAAHTGGQAHLGPHCEAPPRAAPRAVSARPLGREEARAHGQPPPRSQTCPPYMLTILDNPARDIDGSGVRGSHHGAGLQLDSKILGLVGVTCGGRWGTGWARLISRRRFFLVFGAQTHTPKMCKQMDVFAFSQEAQIFLKARCARLEPWHLLPPRRNICGSGARQSSC